MCLSGCSGLTGSKKETMDYSQPINHLFIKDSEDTGFFVCHYNGQTIFTYDDYENCYYQMEFTSSTPKKFTLYSRTKASTTPIEIIAKGTFEGDPYKEGTIKLTVAEGNSAFQTITIEKNNSGILCFTGDVAVSHQYIGAVDSK